jgi:mannose-6-phosphate isomerase
VRPVVLPQNAVPRFYRGGAAIAALRGIENAPERTPEEWVGSTTTVFGEQELGLSRLPDGRLVRDAMAADPLRFFGPDHAAQRGADPCLLVKLLDAGERLPVHLHPGREFARERLGSRWGKTEAWLILEADPGATVHAGLREPVDAATLRRWVDEQDAAEMLAALHELPVDSGDALLIPAGTLHAIGAGILLLELQEPSDLSVLVEWRRFGVNSGAEHLNLGWEDALTAVDRAAADPSTFTAARTGALLPAAADPYFRAERAGGGSEAEPSFAILVVLAGAGTLRTERGNELQLSAGMTALVPYAAGATTLTGELDAIRCLPPDPAAGEGAW